MSEREAQPLDPIFVVGAPRVGARLVAWALAQAPGLWSSDDNARDPVDRLPRLHPSARDWDSGRLDANDVDASREPLARLLIDSARDRDDRRPPAAPTAIRVLSVSPLHALRVPFLAAAFPSAQFVYVHRDHAAALASAIEAWRTRRFASYPRLPGWHGPPWSFPLIAGWRDLVDRPFGEAVAEQWQHVTHTLLGDLEVLSPERWAVVDFDRLLAEPQSAIDRLASFLGLEWDRTLTAPLPQSQGAITPPAPGKWRGRGIGPLLPIVEPAGWRSAALVAEPPAGLAGVAPAVVASPVLPAAGFDSDYTASFVELLLQLGSSLVVSTYQSGRLILVRASADGLNTHFRLMPSPMGVAVGSDWVAVGTRRGVTTFRNHPALARNLAPAGRFDGAFLPLRNHVTGDIRIHDLVEAAGELWAVSTRFSALVTFDDAHSFVPRWQPSFVSALTTEDRCHLNGCAVVDDDVRYLSALGTSDTPGGWRDDKGRGGVVVDRDSGEIVVAGLSMPHSPRWYDGRLWVLESGIGSIGTVDLATGTVTTVAVLPGFTRGLAFAGRYAFVGLSQVRESVFRGLPVAETQHRECGVWVVDTQSGAIAGFLRFTGAVREIFDVQLLPGFRWPELADTDGPLSDGAFLIPPAP